MGDKNWDIFDEHCIGARLVKDIADEYGLKQQIKKPPRITPRCSTLIDIIVTNMKNIAYSGCLNYDKRSLSNLYSKETCCNREGIQLCVQMLVSLL